MKNSRAQKLARLVKVQRQIEKMAENELSYTMIEQVAVREGQDVLAGVVSSLDPIHAAMSPHYIKRFQRLSAKEQALEHAKVVQEKRVLVEKTKGDRLAGQAEEAAQHEERESTDEALLDLLEQSMGAALRNTRPA